MALDNGRFLLLVTAMPPFQLPTAREIDNHSLRIWACASFRHVDPNGPCDYSANHTSDGAGETNRGCYSPKSTPCSDFLFEWGELYPDLSIFESSAHAIFES